MIRLRSSLSLGLGFYLAATWKDGLLSGTNVVWTLGLDLAKSRPPPKPPQENPTHGLGWVLVSRPMGGVEL